jgi:hypothetical protein
MLNESFITAKHAKLEQSTQSQPHLLKFLAIFAESQPFNLALSLNLPSGQIFNAQPPLRLMDFYFLDSLN